MKTTLAALLLALGFAFAPAFVTAAEDTPKKEKPAKEKPSKEKAKIEWVEVTKESGELKRPDTNNNNNNRDQKVEPKVIEFDVEGQGFRISWKTEPLGDKRGGTMKTTLTKKSESGGKVKFANAGSLGTIRAGAEGAKAFTGAGTYKLELEGGDLKYEITVEAATKKSAEASEK